MNRQLLANFPDLEREIEATLTQHQTPLPRPVALPAPIPTDIGRMSGEAVLAQYEIAAKAVEAMGHEVKASIAGMSGSMSECDKDMKIIAECAEMVREKGRRVQVQIEHASAQSTEIRDVCAELKRKLGL